jgi:dolichol-phosphate mannosyltransferase
MNPALSLVIPAYNEEDCIAGVIEEIYFVLERSGMPFELIAVQNGSSDKTGEILSELGKDKKHLRVLEIPVNCGFGFGVIQGLKECSGEIIGYMPGDGQIPPETVPALVEKMKKVGSQIGKGCRIVRNDGLIRKIITVMYNSFVWMLFRLPTSDVNSNPKLMTIFAYRAIQPVSHDFFIDPEILLKANKLGLTFCEVEYVSPKRDRGRSKVAVFRVGLKFFMNLIKVRFMKNDPWGINLLKPVRSMEYSQR